MTPMISVIIPVYNVEKYLERCINSILSQTFTDFELLIVDDGSTDSSGKICDDFSNVDKRIKVIHKQNGGAAEARNTALDLAEGTYIAFIDSDDFVDLDMFEKTYNLIMNEEADILISNHYVDREDKSSRFYMKDELLRLNSEQAIQLVFECKKSTVISCSKLYKRSIFKTIRFPVGKICEDGFVIVDVLSRASKIIYDSHAYYHYAIREGSVTTAQYTAKAFDAIEAYSINLKKIQSEYPAIENCAWFRYFDAINFVLNKLTNINNVMDNKDDIYRIHDLLKKDWKKISNVLGLSIARKVLMHLFVISPRFYVKIERLRTHIKT